MVYGVERIRAGGLYVSLLEGTVVPSRYFGGVSTFIKPFVEARPCRR
jgi:hypothetical protein